MTRDHVTIKPPSQAEREALRCRAQQAFPGLPFDELLFRAVSELLEREARLREHTDPDALEEQLLVVLSLEASRKVRAMALLGTMTPSQAVERWTLLAWDHVAEIAPDVFAQLEALLHEQDSTPAQEA